jgi:predicted acyl esterase
MSDSLAIERDVAIPMRDGSPLYANIYRPGDSDRYPVVMTVGPYGKDLHFGDFNPAAYA